MGCLDEARIAEFVCGALGEADIAAIEEHLASCPECRRLVSEVARSNPVVSSPRSPASSSAPPPPASPSARSTRSEAIPLADAELIENFERETDPLVTGDLAAGRYRVVRRLGHGGMGMVFEAEDVELGERVAVKVLLATRAQDPSWLRGMKREVQLARKVTHPNVCRIFDLEFHDLRPAGRPGERLAFLTMELLAGETLADRLRREGRMEARAALPLVRQMASALEAAHRAGVIHGDFKSGNVMLVPGKHEGEPLRAVVMDFGMARTALSSTTGPGPSHRETTLPTAGLVGTPAYMAPEQVEGGRPGAPADLYALGVVLYEMLCGALPFQGNTPLETAIRRLVTPPPSPRERVPDLDPRLEALILRCLARDLAERFASASELLAALPGARTLSGSDRATTATPGTSSGGPADATLPGGPPPASPEPLPEAPTTHRPRTARIAALAAVGLLAAGGAVVLWHGRQPPAARRGTPLASGHPDLPAASSSRKDAGRGSREVASRQAIRPGAPAGLDQGLRAAETELEAGQAKEALAVVERLRQQLPPEQRSDARLDLLEARARLELGERRRAKQAATRAAARAEVQGAPLVKAAARALQATLFESLADLELARSAAREAEQIYEKAGDRRGKAAAIAAQGAVLANRGEHQAARKLFLESLRLCREQGNRAGAAHGLLLLAELSFVRGNFDEARRLAGESLALSRELGARHRIVPALLLLGKILSAQGRLDEAAAVQEELLSLARSAGRRELQALCLGELALVRIQQADLAGCEALTAEMLSIVGQAGSPGLLPLAFSLRADVAIAAGRLAEAQEALDQALASRTQLGQRPNVAFLQYRKADLALETGDAAAAEAVLRRLVRELSPLDIRGYEVEARSVLVRALLLLGKTADANHELRLAEAAAKRGLARAHSDLVLRTTRARVQAATGKREEAGRGFASVVSDSRAMGFRLVELEARLLGAENSLAQPGTRRQAQAILGLEELAKEATARGCLLVAGKAKQALAQARPGPARAATE